MDSDVELHDVTVSLNNDEVTILLLTLVIVPVTLTVYKPPFLGLFHLIFNSS